MANPVEVLKREKHGFDVWPDVLAHARLRTPMKEIPASDLERMKWYGVFYRKRDAPGSYMLRIRITANELSAVQAKEIARIAYELGYGIVDITTRSNPEGLQRIHDFMSSGLEGFATLEEAADAIAAYTPNRKKRVNPAGLMKVLRQKPDGRWYWHWDPRFIAQGRQEAPREDFQRLFEAALRNIKVPTLLVRGLLSDIVTEEGVEEFLREIPGSKLVDVGDAAHMVAGDQNDAFSNAVIDFLEHEIRPRLQS